MDFSIIRHKIDEQKVCVLIPTYNNHKTLKRVIDGVLEYTNQIIVINDGSTDSTSEILKDYHNQLLMLTSRITTHFAMHRNHAFA